MMKIFRIILIFFAVLFSLILKVQAGEEIPLAVHRESVTETVYLSALTHDNITCFPVRDLSQVLDMPFEWFGETGSLVWPGVEKGVVLTRDLDIVYIVVPGAEQIITEIKWSSCPYIYEDRLYIPVRMLETAGAVVSYDRETGQRSIAVREDTVSGAAPAACDYYTAVKERIAAEIARRPKLLSSFTTLFDPGYLSRTQNLRLAADALNGREILPGEVFSFNDIVGPRVPQRGFEKAIVFVNKKKVEDYGGGVCQVSTTVYNAVLEAGLPVVERHPHSLPVTYVAAGRDATVSYGAADFRFLNNTPYILYLDTSIEKNRLTVKIYQKPAIVNDLSL